jgi:hypothetical protein
MCIVLLMIWKRDRDRRASVHERLRTLMDAHQLDVSNDRGRSRTIVDVLGRLWMFEEACEILSCDAQGTVTRWSR